MSVKRTSNILTLVTLPLMTWVLVACSGNGQPEGSSSSASNSSSTSSVPSSLSSDSSKSASFNSSSEGVTAARLVVAVNAGGQSALVDGVEFDADKFARGGGVYASGDAISGTEGDAVFQSERYGDYAYEVPVSDAQYSVRLYFSELFHNAEGARVFNVTVEGQAVLIDLDVFERVGHDAAFTQAVNDIAVADGSLTITLSPSVDNATLSGFAVYSDNGELEEPEYPTVEAGNPNIWADVPDMSVVRVGDVYYMSSTTMHLNPGVPIMKSTDLVNWEVVNYAHTALDSNNNALNMNGANAYSRGTWASSINYKDGTFYVTSFSYTTNRTYIWRTNNIEGGSWTQTVLPALYHDASLLLDDDGRNYLAYGHDDIRLVEINDDFTGVKAGGVNQQIITKASSVAGSNFILTAEGTQIQKINGWYYVSNICWPSGSSRTQIIHRSKSITGPYEGRVALQDRGVAQGQYISTAEGDWYLYAFRDSGAVGRIPWLVPVTWQDDWPVVGVDGKAPQTLGFEVEDKGMQGIVRSDEFSTSPLDLVWQWNHNPDPAGWSLSERPGYLRITNTRTDSSFTATRNTLTQRMFGPTSTGVVAIDVSGLKDGDTAGIGALQSKYGFVGVTQNGSNRAVTMVNAQTGMPQEVERVPLDTDLVYLRVHGDFRNQVDDATFAYSLDGTTWRDIGNTLQMSYDLAHFMGYRFALFNFGSKSSGGYADFDFFHVSQ